MTIIRDATDDDFRRMCDLNESEVRHTSRMDLDRLARLFRMSRYCKVALDDGEVAAFVIALRDGCPYANENYAWFTARFERFLYVDRIVVGSRAAGRGIGSALYRDLFAFAKAQAIRVITCEYNIEPPNPGSGAFHGKFDFTEIGRRWIADGTKLVSLQAAELRPTRIPECESSGSSNTSRWTA